MPDLTDERAAKWWTDKRRYLVEEVGVDGFKTDGGEHAWGNELVYLDGRRGDEKNNTFPVAYPKAPPHLGEDDDAVRSWLATTPARAARLATAGPRTEGEA